MTFEMTTPTGDCKDDIQDLLADSDEIVGDINCSMCSMCLQEFKIPRILPCMHTFCQHCLNDYILSLDLEKEQRTQFPCPFCRQEIKPPFPEISSKEWAAMFKQSPVLLAMLYEGKSNVEYNCSMCALDGRVEPVTDICITCNDVFCARCTTYHRNLKATKGHMLVSKNKMIHDPQEMMKFVDMYTCIEHDGEEIKFYCEEHKAECCASCFLQKHRKCPKVHDLKAEVKQMTAVRSPKHTIGEMKKLETHLHKIVQAVNKAHSHGNKLKEKIPAMRVNFDGLLVKLEQTVDMEESHKEEARKKANQCLSLAAAINSSSKMLQLASQHGSDTQLLLTLMRSESQMKNYTEQVCCKFQEVESVHHSVELHPYLSELLSLNTDDVVKVKIEKRKETIPVREATRKKQDKSQIEKTSEVVVECPDRRPYHYPLFSGAVYLPEGNIMLVDTYNNICCLYNSSFEHISHYVCQLTNCNLHDVSVVSNREVVISLSNSKQLLFLSVEQEIRLTSTITTPFNCTGIATLYEDRFIVSGVNDKSNYYWSIISRSGEELSYHDIRVQNVSYRSNTTYLAVDESRTHIYMSCSSIHTLFCFNPDGQQIFIYKENGLNYPYGIGLDGEGNIYLVDSSPKVHKVSPDGTALEIIKSIIPQNPQKICFCHNSDLFFITQGSNPKEVIYVYKV